MTNLFQPLDLIVSGSAKAYMKRKFNEWYSTSISRQLDEGKAVDDIEVELKLSVLKPINAGWIKDLYDYLTSEKNAWLSQMAGKQLLSTDVSRKIHM